jgi:hypothetical protein
LHGDNLAELPRQRQTEIRPASRRHARAPLVEAIPETSRMKVHNTGSEGFNSY